MKKFGTKVAFVTNIYVMSNDKAYIKSKNKIVALYQRCLTDENA